MTKRDNLKVIGTSRKRGTPLDRAVRNDLKALNNCKIAIDRTERKGRIVGFILRNESQSCNSVRLFL